ncbi:MAG: hypothetical protein ACE5DR_00740 [Thermodesulfobacteriota bacterium]
MSDYIKFLAKGGGTTGMGHVKRSINVAHALKEMNMPVYFLFDGENSATGLVEENGFSWSRFKAGRPALAEGPAGVVVMDTDDDVSEYVESFKKKGSKVLLIDNVTKASGAADLSITPSALKADSLVKDPYSGSKFVIVGENFFMARKTMKAREHSLPLRVLVTMGWCDSNNITLKVLKALSSMEDIHITVVLGPEYPFMKTMEPFREEHGKRIKFFYAVKDMAPLMASAHIAFTSLGATVYELAFMGVPPVILSNYREDEKDLASLKRLKAGVSLGFFKSVTHDDIQRITHRFVEQAGYWKEASRQARLLTDGKGAWRIASIIAELYKRGGQRL